MARTRHEEVERKYTVGHEAALPDLTRVDGIAGVRALREVDLAATYFDTADWLCCSTGSPCGGGSAGPTRAGT